MHCIRVLTSSEFNCSTSNWFGVIISAMGITSRLYMPDGGVTRRHQRCHRIMTSSAVSSCHDVISGAIVSSVSVARVHTIRWGIPRSRWRLDNAQTRQRVRPSPIASRTRRLESGFSFSWEDRNTASLRQYSVRLFARTNQLDRHVELASITKYRITNVDKLRVNRFQLLCNPDHRAFWRKKGRRRRRR